MFKVKSVQTERKKYREALAKAKGTRSQGYADLVVAAVLLLLGIALLVVAVQLLSSAQAF
jgi:hypothetical protein